MRTASVRPIKWWIPARRSLRRLPLIIIPFTGESARRAQGISRRKNPGIRSPGCGHRGLPRGSLQVQGISHRKNPDFRSPGVERVQDVSFVKAGAPVRKSGVKRYWSWVPALSASARESSSITARYTLPGHFPEQAMRPLLSITIRRRWAPISILRTSFILSRWRRRMWNPL